MTEPTLFDSPLPRHMDVPLGEFAGRARHSDPETSQDAAKRITGRTPQQILALMADGRDRTADEIGHALPNVWRSTLHGAVSRLVEKQLLVWTRELRPSDTGSPMQVYRAVHENEENK